MSQQSDYEFTPAAIVANVTLGIAGVLNVIIIALALRDGDQGLALTGGGMLFVIIGTGGVNYVTGRRECTSDDEGEV